MFVLALASVDCALTTEPSADEEGSPGKRRGLGGADTEPVVTAVPGT
jgi:hypothetical protein